MYPWFYLGSMYHIAKFLTINLHFYMPTSNLLNECLIPLCTIMIVRIHDVPVTWCLVACMVAPCRSSDTNVAPLSVVVFTVSFSFRPTDSPASCWWSSPSPDSDVNNMMMSVISCMRFHSRRKLWFILPLNNISVMAFLSCSPLTSRVRTSPAGGMTSEIFSVTKKRRLSSSRLVTLARTVWPSWKLAVVSLMNLSAMAWKEEGKRRKKNPGVETYRSGQSYTSYPLLTDLGARPKRPYGNSTKTP